MNQPIEVEILQRLKRIEAKLDSLRKAKQKSIWVRAREVADFTGWSKEKMRTMRKNGIVKTRRVGKRYEYDISSIPTIFLKSF